MTPARWQQIKDALHAVLDHPTEQRPARLAAVCGDDTDLRREASSLLAMHRSGGTALDRSAEELAAHLRRDPVDALVGRHVGPYRLVRLVGTGGMGAVYLGERADRHYEKQVAVKLIKRGMDTDATVRRFHTERRVLVRLDHPHIARLLDGGSTADGLPYFIMEYVAGVPVTQYAERAKLPLAGRLQLFRQVCAAVHFAHQRLVIHRDLKPGNILVTPEGEPKLMDFGVAKLLDPAPDDEFFAPTATGSCPMTPVCASPEQVRGEAITTASDVYALGALLYELLAGRPAHAVAGRPAPEVARIICEETPVRPSAVSGRRELRGDLDNVVGKAMHKEPARRYPSAAQLAADVGRYLDGRPITARQDTFLYRAHKFIRRNRAGTAAAVAVALALLGGSITTAWQARRAERERARAERRFNDVRKLAESFLFELDGQIEKGPTHARKVLVDCAREYLDGLSREAAGDRVLQRELAAAYQKLGDVQSRLNGSNIGDTAGALDSYRRALALREELLAAGQDDPALRTELAVNYERLGDMLSKTGRMEEAIRHYERSAFLLEKMAGAHPDRDLSLRLVGSQVALGRALLRTGDLPGGERHLVRAREVLGVPPPDDPDLGREELRVNQCLGYLASLRGHHREALDLYRRNLAVGQRRFEANPGDATLKRSLMDAREWVAIALRDNGQPDEALAMHRAALRLCQEALATDPTNIQANNDLADVSHEIGNTLLYRGDARAALESYGQARRHYDLVAASDPANMHVRRQQVLVNEEEADALDNLGDPVGALARRREDLPILESLASADPTNVEFQRDFGLCLEKTGETMVRNGDWEKAGPCLRRALQVFDASSARSPTNAQVRADLAGTCHALGSLCEHAMVSDDAHADDHRREAQRWYQRSHDVRRTLEAEGVLSNRPPR